MSAEDQSASETPEIGRSPQAEAVEALCAAAATGDADALEMLFLGHHARLLGLARRKIGPEWSGRIEPEDVLQEAYADAFAHVSGFEGRDAESFYRWMARIIENRFYDHIRRWRSKKREVSREVGRPADGGSSFDRLLERCRPEELSPSKAVGREEAVAAVMMCLARLPEDYRAVVRRVCVEHESYEAVASDLGRSPEAVRKLVGRGLEKLRACLGRRSRYLSQG